MCNSGHFNVEINIPGLRAMAVGEPRLVRPFVEQFRLPDGRAINLLAEGRLVNLSAAEGHPASVMDMSFANQALGAEYMLREGKSLENRVYTIGGNRPEIPAEAGIDGRHRHARRRAGNT